MNILNYASMRVSIFFVILTVISTFVCGCAHSNDSKQPQLQPGNRYKIVGPVYYSGIYLNLNKRQLNKQMAVGDLTAVQFTGPEVAFQSKVPVGTIMTIIGPAPKSFRLDIPFFPDRYYVRLDPDLSRGLDIELELNRGIEGSLDGLDPELFEKVHSAE
jgi:hypothetical protein